MTRTGVESSTAVTTDRDTAGAALTGISEDLLAAAQSMAQAFAAGGTLLAFAGHDADAHHVAVEFVHPVVVGKPSLAARAPGLARASRVIEEAGADDIVLGLCLGDPAGVGQALASAQQRGLMTVAVSTRPAVGGTHRLVLPTADPLIARELQVTVYHLLWELVHVHLESGVEALR